MVSHLELKFQWAMSQKQGGCEAAGSGQGQNEDPHISPGYLVLGGQAFSDLSFPACDLGMNHHQPHLVSSGVQNLNEVIHRGCVRMLWWPEISEMWKGMEGADTNIGTDRRRVS